uniref:Ig-like domain-containing protein n=1 Tax=Labrus bergylta TaxID=56723 RepID=A0A3Q3EID8_9LABR
IQRGFFLLLITSVVQDISQDQVHPGDLMTLQCSVLSESENNTCPGKHRVFWFRAGSDENHPSVIYTHGNRPGGCEESPETHSPQKCVYSFSKTVNSSDASTYFCAVAACGEILFGKGTKIDIKGNSSPRTEDFSPNVQNTAVQKQLCSCCYHRSEQAVAIFAKTFFFHVKNLFLPCLKRSFLFLILLVEISLSLMLLIVRSLSTFIIIWGFYDVLVGLYIVPLSLMCCSLLHLFCNLCVILLAANKPT